ncbi:MAG: GNAT family N-acetyltransferase [Chloroflexi bacterium]|nr:GNAT family N-acetyltransferase [Chloroflexota bacterium]
MADTLVNLTAYTEPEVFDLLKGEWNELLERSASNRIFSTWEWEHLWWQAYCPGQLWVITCRDDNGRLLGIAPWFIENRPHKTEPRRINIVRSIGCVDVTDYLDIIVDRDHIDVVVDALAAYVDQQCARYDVIDLCNIPETSLTRDKFVTALQARGYQVTVKQQEVCPRIDLPDDFETYLDSLDKKDRHELRRKLRRAEGEANAVSWYIVGSEHDLHREFESFLTLMAASSPEKAEFLQDPRNAMFFKNIVYEAFNKGWLQLNFLTVGGQPAAAYLNFDYAGQIMVYNSGLIPQTFGHLSPGIVLLCHNIRHAIENGRTIFDFLRGNERYKYRMGGKDLPVYMMIAEK